MIDDYVYHPLIEKILNAEYPIVECFPNHYDYSYNYRFRNDKDMITLHMKVHFNDVHVTEYFLYNNYKVYKIPERDFQAAVTMYKIIR